MMTWSQQRIFGSLALAGYSLLMVSAAAAQPPHPDGQAGEGQHPPGEADDMELVPPPGGPFGPPRRDGPPRHDGPARHEFGDRPFERRRGDRRGPMRGKPLDEGEVLAFVEEHHPELLKAIDWLKEQRPTQYGMAMRAVGDQISRLNMLRSRKSKRYEPELEIWKVESRIRLLAVQMSLNANDDRKSELRELIADQLQFRTEAMKIESERLDDQIRSLERRKDDLAKRIETAENEPELAVDRMLDSILKQAKRRLDFVRSRRDRPKKDKPDKKAPRAPSPPETETDDSQIAN